MCTYRPSIPSHCRQHFLSFISYLLPTFVSIMAVHTSIVSFSYSYSYSSTRSFYIEYSLGFGLV